LREKVANMVEGGSRISDSDSADEIDHTRGRMKRG